jgi:hypothetical protein
MAKMKLSVRTCFVTALCAVLLACSADQPTATRDTGGTLPALIPGLGFVTSSFGFYYPSEPETGFEGFDLDGRVSSVAAPGAEECAHDDFTMPNGDPGIDYALLRIIEDDEIREDGKFIFGGFHEGQLVDGVISGAVKNGSMTVLLQVDGVDDPVNDDDVRIRIFGSEDSPVLGTDNSVLRGATLGVHSDSRYHSGEARGAIVDGILTAGPIDLRFPVDIMIVRDELFIHDSWVRLELGEGSFTGTVAGYWDVKNIRDIIGKPTTDNGNAANFTIEQFDAAMLDFADGNYDGDSGTCASLSTMFRIGGVQAFLVEASEPDGIGGAGGAGGGGGVIQTPVDQCLNDADQAALEAIATEQQSGPAVVGMLAGECPLSACGTELGVVLGDSSEPARNAFGDCIAQCISDQTGLSAGCTGCYGSIAACSTALCLAPCAPPNSGSEECVNCALENCIDINACTGL